MAALAAGLSHATRAIPPSSREPAIRRHSVSVSFSLYPCKVCAVTPHPLSRTQKRSVLLSPWLLLCRYRVSSPRVLQKGAAVTDDGEENKEVPPEEKEYQELMRRQQEEEEDEKEVYRRLESKAKHELQKYPAEEVLMAKRTVSDLILAGEGIEEMIVKLADENKINDVLLQVICNRLELARQDNEKDVIRCLDLLQRRLETERMSRAASPAMRLLNELLQLYEGGSERPWIRKARQKMLDSFVPEDPSLIFLPQMMVPNGEEEEEGSIFGKKESREVYRIEFIREVDDLVAEAKAATPKDVSKGLDAASVAVRLQWGERLQAIQHAEQLRDLAISLRW